MRPYCLSLAWLINFLKFSLNRKISCSWPEHGYSLTFEGMKRSTRLLFGSFIFYTNVFSRIKSTRLFSHWIARFRYSLLKDTCSGTGLLFRTLPFHSLDKSIFFAVKAHNINMLLLKRHLFVVCYKTCIIYSSTWLLLRAPPIYSLDEQSLSLYICRGFDIWLNEIILGVSLYPDFHMAFGEIRFFSVFT